MNTKTEIPSTPISELNVESDNNEIRIIEDSELAFVTGGITFGTYVTGAVVVMGAPLFGSTYTQTQIAGQ